MRVLLRLGPVVTLCAILGGCSDDVVPPAQAPSASVGAVAPPASPYVTAAWGASARLVGEAQNITSPAWRAATRAALLRADRSSGVPPTAAELDAQLDQHRNEALLQVVASMEAVGGPEVVAYCLWLGENELAPPEIRKAALAVLVRHADRNDPTTRTRSKAIWERVTALGGVAKGAVGNVGIGAATLSGGGVSNASQVVASMQAAFRRCYNSGLHEDPNMAGSIRVTAKIGVSGNVVSTEESHTGLSPMVALCVVTRVSAAVFTPPEGGGATVVIPVTFMIKD